MYLSDHRYLAFRHSLKRLCSYTEGVTSVVQNTMNKKVSAAPSLVLTCRSGVWHTCWDADRCCCACCVLTEQTVIFKQARTKCFHPLTHKKIPDVYKGLALPQIQQAYGFNFNGLCPVIHSGSTHTFIYHGKHFPLTFQLMY